MEEKKKRGRPPGLPKTGGRKKGTVAHVRQATQENVRLFVNGNFDEAEAAWHKIKDPATKFMAYLKALEFVYPKLKAVEFKAEDSKTTLEAKMLIMMQQTAKKEVEDAESEDLS